MAHGGKLTIETCNVVLDEDYAAINTDVVAGDYVVVAVTDSGHGIPTGILENVFEPFFTTKDVDKGSGLGLSMVYGFVKQSNGHIRIYSEEGHGTTVRLYLPPATGIAKPAAAAVVPALEGGDETILVVEDDNLVRDLRHRPSSRALDTPRWRRQCHRSAWSSSTARSKSICCLPT